MSRESKILRSTVEGAADTIRDYESFGWELLSITNGDIAMSRETQNPVYNELVKYQNQYEVLLRSYNALRPPVQPSPVVPKTCLYLFILAIFPMVIYLVYKSRKRAAYEQQLAEYQSERGRLYSAMQQVCNDSRATFFARQTKED